MMRPWDRIVPWPKVQGKEIHTNGYTEDALGLTNIIDGWGPEGYYVPVHSTPEAVQAKLDEIDWVRVKAIQDAFEMKMGRGGLVLTDRPVFFVTVRRYQRLMRQCLKTVPTTVYAREIAAAVAAAGGKSSTVSGSLT